MEVIIALGHLEGHVITPSMFVCLIHSTVLYWGKTPIWQRNFKQKGVGLLIGVIHP
jgi:hypothetical protein